MYADDRVIKSLLTEPESDPPMNCDSFNLARRNKLINELIAKKLSEESPPYGLERHNHANMDPVWYSHYKLNGWDGVSNRCECGHKMWWQLSEDETHIFAEDGYGH